MCHEEEQADLRSSDLFQPVVKKLEAMTGTVLSLNSEILLKYGFF